MTKTIILDLETTVQRLEGKIDNSPFNPKNRCVSAHWKMRGDPQVQSRVFYHVEQDTPDSPADLIAALESADVLVAHNAKFDVLWLRSMGLPVPEKVYCTMIGEYIFARGQRAALSLHDSALRNGVAAKKSDLIDEAFKKEKKDFSEIDLADVLEYAEGDVVSCEELYEVQIKRLAEDVNAGLHPVFELMNDMLLFLVEIETNGVCIDLAALNEVEEDFLREKREIEKRLNEIVEEVMGDTPINLNSGPDLTMVVYSRRVIDRERHKETFNIGTDARGKPLYPPRMSPSQFTQAVRATTEVVKRTVAECCPECNGSGYYYRVKNDGTKYKKANKCKGCSGEGVVYVPNGKVAGLKLSPEGPRDASINGFKADKTVVKRLIAQAESKGNLTAVEFLTKFSRLNAVNTYLTSFVNGIRYWTRPDSILHPNFNQCVTATGRLSSSDPNFQNQPKGGKFPVRRAVVSRFEGGEILEADFSALEFRVAGILSGDQQIRDDVLNGKDIHSQTAMIINRISLEEVTKDRRQAAKPYSFAPLYGGQGAEEPDHVKTYFREFFTIYRGMAQQHRKWMDGVMEDGIVRIPSGREYYWPNPTRFRSGRISNATQVVNYPVQGFATADIVPLACILALHAFRLRKLKSLLILTVHDSIVVDVYPGELEAVRDALKWAMLDGLYAAMEARWNFVSDIPLAIEIQAGQNWMNMEDVPLTCYPS